MKKKLHSIVAISCFNFLNVENDSYSISLNIKLNYYIRFKISTVPYYDRIA